MALLQRGTAYQKVDVCEHVTVRGLLTGRGCRRHGSASPGQLTTPRAPGPCNAYPVHAACAENLGSALAVPWQSTSVPSGTCSLISTLLRALGLGGTRVAIALLAFNITSVASSKMKRGLVHGQAGSSSAGSSTAEGALKAPP